MRILFVTNIPTPGRDEFFRALSLQNNLSIKVIFCGKTEKSRPWSVPQWDRTYPHEFMKGITIKRDVHMNIGIGHRIIEWNPDIVVIAGVYTMMATQIAIHVCKRNSIPWIYWSEAVKFGPKFWIEEILRSALRKPLLSAEVIMAMGRLGVESFVKLGMPREKIKESAYYHKIDKYVGNRSYLGQTKYAIIGQMIPRKNVSFAIDAFCRAGVKGELHVFGTGPLENSLKQRATEKIIFRGFVQPNTLPSILADMDVLIFPTLYDGWGMVITEAMASGVVVLSSPHAGAAQLLDHGVNGFVIGLENMEEWARIIRRLQCRNTLRDLSLAAINTSLHIDVETGVKSMQEVFNAILSARRYCN